MEVPEIVKTEDGSDTLFATEVGEYYHSTFGAIQESMHVFINAGFRECDQPFINIFEVGFGTGLNAYLTLLEIINSGKKVRYIAVEKNPLPLDLWSVLNYSKILEGGNQNLFRLLHEANWNIEVKIVENFSILKISTDLIALDYSAFPLFDLIYFDAFSPEKQPELWNLSVFQQLANHCAPNSKLVTYCAKGSVRRSIAEAGFSPERIPGPPGKREMLRGIKK
jgi:tRNA U34 5-methylaminomethyl-2-thiouridine-forming methyltransferase MnmC